MKQISIVLALLMAAGVIGYVVYQQNEQPEAIAEEDTPAIPPAVATVESGDSETVATDEIPAAGEPAEIPTEVAEEVVETVDGMTEVAAVEMAETEATEVPAMEMAETEAPEEPAVEMAEVEVTEEMAEAGETVEEMAAATGEVVEELVDNVAEGVSDTVGEVVDTMTGEPAAEAMANAESVPTATAGEGEAAAEVADTPGAEATAGSEEAEAEMAEETPPADEPAMAGEADPAQFFTVDGFDIEEVTTYIIDSDLETEVKETLIAEIKAATDDPEALVKALEAAREALDL